MAEKTKRSFFESRLMRSKIKSQTVSLFPEAGLGYLLGPILALFSNGVINIWLVQYWHNVLGFGSWAPLYETILPIVSSLIIIVGNILVGRLMERKPSLAGKARPLILLGMPIIAVSLLLLFISPVPFAAIEDNILGDAVTSDSFVSGGGLLVSILVAVGYNLYYAFAWPMYYTSHSALVNLSTRDGGKRGLLGTAVMAAQLGAAGISGMFGGFFVDLLKLMPVYRYDNQFAWDNGLFDDAVVDKINKGIYTIETVPLKEAATTSDFTKVQGLIKDTNYFIDVTRKQANEKWMILMIVMIVALVIGCLLEYFFTRERITEENIKNAEAGVGREGEVQPSKKVTMKEQMAICLKDKGWWLLMIFWFLYQFGGMMKNNSMSFFSMAYTGKYSLSSLINTVGAAPTAIGMVFVWPLAAKFTKSKTISLGGVVAAIGASLAFLCLAFPTNGTAVTGVSIASFCIKALGTAPAMYISLALMANVLDHQEAVHGVRTDGFTMAVYGSIMVAMSGVCNGIIVGLDNAIPEAAKQFLHTFLAYGVEGICYVIIAVMFIFLNVERFTNADNKAIVFDQKAEVLAAGGQWIEPDVRAKQEEEENNRLVEEARISQLKASCEKKGLNFEEENAKFLAKKAEADAKAAQKKADAEAKKQAKLDAMSEEQKKALEEKKAAAQAKQEQKDAEALIDLNKIREKNNRAPVVL